MAIIYSYPLVSSLDSSNLFPLTATNEDDELYVANVTFSTLASEIIDEAFNGTDRYIPRFGGTSSLVNSVIYEDSNSNIGIGTTSPSQKLHVVGSARVTGAYYDSNNSSGTSGQVLSSTATGTDWVSLVDGTGTTNYVAKWLDTDTITNSVIYDNGTNVGIGTTSPSELLHLSKTGSNPYIRISADSFTGLDVGQETSAGNAIINLRDNKDIRIFTNSAEVARIKNNGNVGIGTTSPTAKLHVEAATTEDIKLNVNEGNVRIVSSSSNGSFFVTSFDTITMTPENTFSIGSNFYVDYVDNHVGFGTNNPNDFVQIVGDSDPKTSLSLLSEDNALSVKPNSSTDTKFTVNRGSGTDILLQASNTAGTVANDIKINPFGGDLFVGQKPAAETFSNGGSIKFDVGDYGGNTRIVTLQSKASSEDGGGFQFKSNNLTLFSILPDDNGNVTYNFSSTDSFTVNAQSNLTLTGDEGVTISSNADEGFLLKESGTTFLQTRVDQFSNDGTGCETTSLKTGRFGIAALSTPASSSATGTTGEIRVDANYIYVCTATNTWKRTQINTW